MQQCNFEDYPAGTRVQIGARVFERKDHGTFWVEEHEVPGNRISRPSASLRSLEVMMEISHVVLRSRPHSMDGRLHPVPGHGSMALSQADAQALNSLMQAIEAGSDAQPDWVDAVCTAKDRLPAPLRGALFAMASQPQDLLGICRKAAGLIRSSHGQERLEDYAKDAQNGLLTADRLKGFLQGLCCGEALLPEDYDDLDRMMLGL